MAASLYLHFPLCAVKCTYCDFYSLPGEGHDADRVLDLLLRDCEREPPESPPTVFMGGGTPTYHGPQALARFLDRLDALTGFRASATEVTVECNPESLDREKAQALLEGGVQRLSIGVQSLRPAILERFGRAHSVEQAFAAVEAAKAAGFERLSTDLIYAVPGQTTREWLEDLDRVLDLGLEHLSAYNLTFEPGTALERERRAGRVEPSDEEVELEMFWETRRHAAAAGLEAYEVSNLARPGRSCEHNLAYWRGDDYAGFGPSAVSRRGGVRSGHVRNLSRWRAAVEAGDSPRDWAEELDPLRVLTESWWLGLRLTEGVVPAALLARAEWRGPDPTADLVRRLSDQGLLERRGERITLTDRGLPLADAVGREFLSLEPVGP